MCPLLILLIIVFMIYREDAASAQTHSVRAWLYWISCSKLSNKGDEKKSNIVISNPSQIF